MDRRPWEALARVWGGRLTFDAPLRALTTLGVGGPAAILARPETAEEVAAALDLARRENLPFFILGGGSNVLFADEGFQGLVIKLGEAFEAVERSGAAGLVVGAAAASVRALNASADWGLAGLEGLAGIPGTVGGAVFMNAGGSGREVGPAVERVFFLDGPGRLSSLGRSELAFEYRRLSGLPRGAVILNVEFALTPDRPEAIRARVRTAQERRAQTQPKGLRSAGSVFKNPPGLSAGRLIDQCGLKGLTVGGARVSEVHANFIVNPGRAESRDIRGLMDTIVAAVAARHGLTLEPEIKVVGPAGEVSGHAEN